MVQSHQNHTTYSVGREGRLVSVRMKPEIHDALRTMCSAKGIPVNTFINRLVIRAIEDWRRQEAL